MSLQANGDIIANGVQGLDSAGIRRGICGPARDSAPMARGMDESPIRSSLRVAGMMHKDCTPSAQDRSEVKYFRK